MSNWYKLKLSEKKNLNLENASIQLPIANLWDIFLVRDWYGRAQPTVDTAIPGQLVLELYKSELSKWFFLGPCFSSRLWVPALTSLSDRLWCGNVSQRNPFLQLFWSWCFITAIITLTKTKDICFFTFMYPFMGVYDTCTKHTWKSIQPNSYHSNYLSLCNHSQF